MFSTKKAKKIEQHTSQNQQVSFTSCSAKTLARKMRRRRQHQKCRLEADTADRKPLSPKRSFSLSVNNNHLQSTDSDDCHLGNHSELCEQTLCSSLTQSEVIPPGRDWYYTSSKTYFVDVSASSSRERDLDSGALLHMSENKHAHAVTHIPVEKILDPMGMEVQFAPMVGYSESSSHYPDYEGFHLDQSAQEIMLARDFISASSQKIQPKDLYPEVFSKLLRKQDNLMPDTNALPYFIPIHHEYEGKSSCSAVFNERERRDMHFSFASTSLDRDFTVDEFANEISDDNFILHYDSPSTSDVQCGYGKNKRKRIARKRRKQAQKWLQEIGSQQTLDEVMHVDSESHQPSSQDAYNDLLVPAEEDADIFSHHVSSHHEVRGKNLYPAVFTIPESKDLYSLFAPHYEDRVLHGGEYADTVNYDGLTGYCDGQISLDIQDISGKKRKRKEANWKKRMQAQQCYDVKDGAVKSGCKKDKTCKSTTKKNKIRNSEVDMPVQNATQNACSGHPESKKSKAYWRKQKRKALQERLKLESTGSSTLSVTPQGSKKTNLPSDGDKPQISVPIGTALSLGEMSWLTTQTTSTDVILSSDVINSSTTCQKTSPSRAMARSTEIGWDTTRASSLNPYEALTGSINCPSVSVFIPAASVSTGNRISATQNESLSSSTSSNMQQNLVTGRFSNTTLRTISRSQDYDIAEAFNRLHKQEHVVSQQYDSTDSDEDDLIIADADLPESKDLDVEDAAVATGTMPQATAGCSSRSSPSKEIQMLDKVVDSLCSRSAVSESDLKVLVTSKTSAAVQLEYTQSKVQVGDSESVDSTKTAAGVLLKHAQAKAIDSESADTTKTGLTLLSKQIKSRPVFDYLESVTCSTETDATTLPKAEVTHGISVSSAIRSTAIVSEENQSSLTAATRTEVMQSVSEDPEYPETWPSEEQVMSACENDSQQDRNECRTVVNHTKLTVFWTDIQNHRSNGMRIGASMQPLSLCDVHNVITPLACACESMEVYFNSSHSRQDNVKTGAVLLKLSHTEQLRKVMGILGQLTLEVQELKVSFQCLEHELPLEVSVILDCNHKHLLQLMETRNLKTCLHATETEGKMFEVVLHGLPGGIHVSALSGVFPNTFLLFSASQEIVMFSASLELLYSEITVEGSYLHLCYSKAEYVEEFQKLYKDITVNGHSVQVVYCGVFRHDIQIRQPDHHDTSVEAASFGQARQTPGVANTPGTWQSQAVKRSEMDWNSCHEQSDITLGSEQCKKLKLDNQDACSQKKRFEPIVISKSCKELPSFPAAESKLIGEVARCSDENACHPHNLLMEQASRNSLCSTLTCSQSCETVLVTNSEKGMESHAHSNKILVSSNEESRHELSFESDPTLSSESGLGCPRREDAVEFMSEDTHQGAVSSVPCTFMQAVPLQPDALSMLSDKPSTVGDLDRISSKLHGDEEVNLKCGPEVIRTKTDTDRDNSCESESEPTVADQQSALKPLKMMCGNLTDFQSKVLKALARKRGFSDDEIQNHLFQL